ncbi:MAG: fibronectin type III domain-containing protein [Eubacteriaceae bacterium]|jgi:hypothetical protein|nr:fibronectin type III domain-containing protein [Eubacteriaceae bacterium]
MKKTIRKTLCCALALAAAVTLTPLAFPASVLADGAAMTVTAHPDGEAVMVMDGSAVKSGRGRSGSNRDFTLLTQADLDSITDEASADKFFSSEKYDSYAGGTTYSAKRRNDEWALQTVTRGFSLRAAADSLGVDAGASAGTAVSCIAADGYSNTLGTIWKTRYCYSSETDTAGTAVDPAIGLSGKYLDSFGTHNAGDPLDVPVLMVGQESSGDYNAQYMGRFIKNITFGKAKTVLAVDNTGVSANMTMADIVSGSLSKGNIGRQQAVCTYVSDSGSVNITASGVTLDRLFDYYAISSDERTVTAKTADGKTVSLDSGDAEKYFVAYEASADGNALANAGSDIILLCPGTSAKESVVRGVKSIRISLNSPAVTKAKRKSGASVYVKWNRVSGASGYQISCSVKKAGTNKAATVSGAAKSSCTLKGLKKTARYVRVRAYRKTGGVRSYSAWSAPKKIK